MARTKASASATEIVPMLKTVEQMSKYSGIGINKLRDMTNENNCPFVLWNGNKRLIKRRAFERFLDSSYSI